jgi:ParB-like chromosome segregation protein Spo0J
MKRITWHTEKRKVKDLKPYKSNPRQITKEQMAQLKQSIEKFDYAEIVAIQPDNTIIAGHMRIKALISLGRKNDEIDVRVPNRQLAEEEMREYLIRSNKNTGDWDWDALSSNFDLHNLCDWGFTAEDFHISLEDACEDNREEKSNCPTCGKKMRKK